MGLDRDPAALDAARARLSAFGDRVTLIASPFSESGDGVVPPGSRPLAGVLLDLGVSSPQLDWSERGFSFREDGPLDMRMDPTSGQTAADVVNTLPVGDLATLFRQNGEGRLSGRIARAVVQARPLTSTRQLAEVVASAVPAPPAARVTRPGGSSRHCASRSTTSSASWQGALPSPCRTWRSEASAR